MIHARLPKPIVHAIARDRESDWRFAALVAIPYLAFLIWMHAHHEMWRDEIHAWTLSRLAQGFGELITGDRRYEGHPPLWFWYLHVWSWFIKEAWGLQAATILAAFAAALLLLRFAPFPRYLKVLLLCSYYFGYEYTVVSRNYVLGWLFLCLFCAAYHRFRFRYLVLAASLSLLANSSIYGLLMAACLLAFLVLDRVRVSTPSQGAPLFTLSASTQLIAASLIASAAMLFCAIVVQPSDPNLFAPDWHFQYLNLGATPRMLTRLVAGFLPLRHYAVDFWGSSDAIWNRNDPHLGYVGAGILLLTLLALLPSWRLMLIYLVGLLAMELLQQVRYEGHPRHWGQYFVFFVGACWLLRSSLPQRRHLPSLLLLLGMLAFQVQGFVAATVWDTRATFSGGRETAAFIRRSGLQDLPLVGGSSWVVLTVAGYLRRPFISAETEELSETVAFHGRRRWFSMPELVTKAVSVARERKGPVLVVSGDKLTPLPPGVTAPLLFTSRAGTIDDEVFQVYLLSAPP